MAVPRILYQTVFDVPPSAAGSATTPRPGWECIGGERPVAGLWRRQQPVPELPGAFTAAVAAVPQGWQGNYPEAIRGRWSPQQSPDFPAFTVAVAATPQGWQANYPDSLRGRNRPQQPQVQDVLQQTPPVPQWWQTILPDTVRRLWRAQPSTQDVPQVPSATPQGWDAVCPPGAIARQRPQQPTPADVPVQPIRPVAGWEAVYPTIAARLRPKQPAQSDVFTAPISPAIGWECIATTAQLAARLFRIPQDGNVLFDPVALPNTTRGWDAWYPDRTKWARPRQPDGPLWVPGVFAGVEPTPGGMLCLTVSAAPGLYLSVSAECGGSLELSVSAAPGLFLSVAAECC